MVDAVAASNGEAEPGRSLEVASWTEPAAWWGDTRDTLMLAGTRVLTHTVLVYQSGYLLRYVRRYIQWNRCLSCSLLENRQWKNCGLNLRGN
jgi:hypothetical protein